MRPSRRARPAQRPRRRPEGRFWCDAGSKPTHPEKAVKRKCMPGRKCLPSRRSDPTVPGPVSGHVALTGPAPVPAVPAAQRGA